MAWRRGSMSRLRAGSLLRPAGTVEVRRPHLQPAATPRPTRPLIGGKGMFLRLMDVTSAAPPGKELPRADGKLHGTLKAGYAKDADAALCGFSKVAWVITAVLVTCAAPPPPSPGQVWMRNEASSNECNGACP